LSIYQGVKLHSNMVLSRITERIEEEKQKKGKIDGRRFNSRSQKKMMWQVKDLQRLNRKKVKNTSRCGYSKEELEEYRIINEQIRADGEIRLFSKQIVHEIIDKVVENECENLKSTN